MKILAIGLIMLLPSTALTTEAADVATLRTALRDAVRANDAEQILHITRQLLADFSAHPTYLFYHARGQAMTGMPADSLATLREISRRGVDMLTHVENDAAFENVRELPAFADWRAESEHLYQPAGKAQRGWSFGDNDTIPEAVVLADDGRVFLGSVRKREILVRKTDGNVVRWRGPAFWSMQGMHFSTDGRLWAATSAMKETVGVAQEERGRSALLAINGDTGVVLARLELTEPGQHVLGDFLFLDDDTILASDSIGGALYALDIADGTFTQRVPPGMLRSPQGLARLGAYIYVADYSNGLYRFDPSDDSIQRVNDGVAAPYGIDGLYVHGNSLIAIQNGVKPHQVVRFTLTPDGLRINSRELLLANHADFAEPTLGMIVGDTFHFVANSQWDFFNESGDLPSEGLRMPVILSLDIPFLEHE